MRKLVRLAAQLYPRDWRLRYGAEFEALLDDSGSAWKDVFDVLGGAFKMQISMWSFRNVTLACGVIGLLMASGLAWWLPNVYVSRAMLRITPTQIPENLVPETYNRQIADRIRAIWKQVATRGSLAEIIQRPELNLYRNDRQHKPLEDVIDKMKTDDIRIEILAGSFRKPSSAFYITFNYPDPVVAQKTTSALVSKMVDANAMLAKSGTAADNLDLLDPASLPQTPAAPNRWQIVGLGLVAGLATGALVFGVRRALRSRA